MNHSCQLALEFAHQLVQWLGVNLAAMPQKLAQREVCNAKAQLKPRISVTANANAGFMRLTNIVDRTQF
jgi:hypothetical protein